MIPHTIVAEHKQLTAARENLVRTVYLTVQQLMAILDLSDDRVKSIPIEVLPYLNMTPGSSRAHRRYHPDDVSLALRVLWPRYQEAEAYGKAAAFLDQLREERKKYEDALLAQSRGRAA